MKNTLKTLLALVVVVATSAFTTIGTGYDVGDIATDFKLENIDGKHGINGRF